MEKLPSITIVLPSILTVPAIKGGAVETLLENFIEQNEIYKKFSITIIAHYIKGVELVSSKYKYTEFIYIKIPNFLIKINSILSNKFNNFINIYHKFIIEKVVSINNKIVIVEGDRKIALKLKELYPNFKVYLHMHGPFYNFKEGENKQLSIYKSLEKIITVSDFCKYQHMSVMTREEVEEKIVSVKNGIKTSRFFYENIIENDEEIRLKYNIPDGKKIILFKGRIIKEKGIDKLIQAFEKIKREDIILLIVGSKNFGEKRLIKSGYEIDLYNKIKDNNHIILLGYVPYYDIPKINKIAYISVIPSIWEEPAGLVLLESIASQNPTIISNVGGMPEYINPYIINIDVDEKYIDNIKFAINKLLEDDEYYMTIKNGMYNYRGFYNEKRYYEELCKVII